MGGVERASDSAAFQGGDLVAVMGACRLDLRQASIAGSEAVIDVLTVMGGVELRIPETWTVDARVLPLMGGVTDRSRRATGQTATQRLVIRGTAFMGGVEVKN
jgi:predicted membrane protein